MSEIVSINMPRDHVIILLNALKTQFSIKGLAGAEALVEMCKSIEYALINEE